MQLHLIPNVSRAQETSTAEEWRPIPGFEKHYEVSSLGRVRSYRYHRQWHTEPLYLKPFVSKIGYVYYRLHHGKTGQNYAAHRLALLAFVGPSDLDVNHKDGNKQNNTVRNLEYVTAQQNTRHAMEVLGIKIGGHNTHAPETEQDKEIRRLAASGLSQREIARQFGISQPCVSYIVRGKIRPVTK